MESVLVDLHQSIALVLKNLITTEKKITSSCLSQQHSTSNLYNFSYPYNTCKGYPLSHGSMNVLYSIHIVKELYSLLSYFSSLNYHFKIQNILNFEACLVSSMSYRRYFTCTLQDKSKHLDKVIRHCHLSQYLS